MSKTYQYRLLKRTNGELETVIRFVKARNNAQATRFANVLALHYEGRLIDVIEAKERAA